MTTICEIKAAPVLIWHIIGIRINTSEWVGSTKNFLIWIFYAIWAHPRACRGFLKILGHTKPSTTLDIYGHLIPVMQEEAARIMDELVSPIPVEMGDFVEVTPSSKQI